MKPYAHMAAKQRGFSLLTGFILVIMMFGSLAFFLAGQGINAGFGSTYTNTAKVSSLLSSAGYINTGFDAVTLAGTTPANVKFNAATTVGIFNPDSGGASPQPLDPSLFVDVSTQATATVVASGVHGYWIYRKSDIKLNAVGTTASEYAMVASGLQLGVCQQINKTLTGSIAITALTATEAQLVGAPPVAASDNTTSGAAADLSTAALGTANPGQMNGCYSTADSIYVYIHTLLAQ